MELGEKVKQLRKKHGWTQKELADRIDRQQNTISYIENGCGATMETLKAIAYVFNITYEELLKDIIINSTNIEVQNKLISIDSYIEGLIEKGIITDSDDLNDETSKAILSITKAYIDYLIINKK